MERDEFDVTLERIVRTSSCDQVQIVIPIAVYFCNVARANLVYNLLVIKYNR